MLLGTPQKKKKQKKQKKQNKTKQKKPAPLMHTQ